MKKILLCLLLLLPIKINALDLAKTSKSAIMIEASTGKVIFEKDADLKLPPASMTKIMTMLLVFDAIKEGKPFEFDLTGQITNNSNKKEYRVLIEQCVITSFKPIDASVDGTDPLKNVYSFEYTG